MDTRYIGDVRRDAEERTSFPFQHRKIPSTSDGRVGKVTSRNTKSIALFSTLEEVEM